MTRSKGQKHRDAQSAGATLIVIGTSIVVTHDPRNANDNKPWKGSDGKRYASREVGRTVL